MTSWLNSLSNLFSKSTPDKPLLKHIERESVTRIVQIGIGDGSRGSNLISTAAKTSRDRRISYTGIDLFEASEGGLGIKQAHQLLHPLGADVRLVPGNAQVALTRCANELRGTDLVVIADSESAAGIDQVWHLVHRMLHKESQVWVEQTDGTFECLLVPEVTAKMMANQRQGRRKAA
ncbi:MAG: hypothetical protein AAGF97_00070 [Planctomycetota bacterium]